MSDAKSKIAAQYVLDAPPGEMNDVLHDVRNLVEDDDATLQSYIVPALRQYNVEQLSTVTLPGMEYEVVISRFGQLADDVFLDPRSQKKFTLDQVVLSTSNVEVVEPTGPEELRSAVDHASQKYIREHYPKGAVSVFSAGDAKVAVCIVANKYNANNFWSGRWKSIWEYSADSGELTGQVHVKVHYYEDGNVQFETTKKDFNFAVESQSDHAATAKEIFQVIAKAETNYQNAVNGSFLNLLEGTFKGLRRNLPMTRNKIDWDKVVGYKLGAELGNKT